MDKAEDQPQIGKQFVPPMMDPVLGDYARNVPDARESEVLSLFATIVNKYASVTLFLFPFFIDWCGALKSNFLSVYVLYLLRIEW